MLSRGEEWLSRVDTRDVPAGLEHRGVGVNLDVDSENNCELFLNFTAKDSLSPDLV